MAANNFITSVASTAGTSLVIMVSGLITGSLTANLLGAAGRGELASIQLYGSLLAAIATSGLPAAVTYFTGRNTVDAGFYYITGIAAAFLVAIPGAFTGYLAIPYLLSTQRPAVISAAQLYLLFIPLGIITAFSLASLQGQMRMLLWNLLRVIAAIFWVVPLSYLYFFSDNVNAIFVSKTYLFFLLVYSIIFIFILVRSIPGSLQIRREFIKPIWKYAIPTSLATFSQQSNLKLDQIFISALLPPELLGLYVVAIAWSAAHSPLTNAVSYVIVPHLTRLENAEQRGMALSKISRNSLALNLIFAIIIFAITPFAIRILFGMQFLKTVTVCYILLIGSILSNMKLVFAEGLRGLGYPAAVMKGELFGLIISGVLFPVLLKMHGLEGVATASVIGYLATFIFFVAISSKLSGVPVSKTLMPNWQDFVYIADKLIDLVRRIKVNPEISK